MTPRRREGGACAIGGATVATATRLLPESAISRRPEASKTIPEGAESTPGRMTVVTTPDGAMRRIELLPLSATYTLPKASMASAAGALKPAIVATLPSREILRTVLLPLSATQTSLPTAIPAGALSPTGSTAGSCCCRCPRCRRNHPALPRARADD